MSVHCFSGKFPCVVARMSKKVFVCAYGREDDLEDESKDNSDSEDANDLSHLTAFSPSHTMAREKYMAALKSAKWHMNDKGEYIQGASSSTERSSNSSTTKRKLSADKGEYIQGTLSTTTTTSNNSTTSSMCMRINTDIHSQFAKLILNIGNNKALPHRDQKGKPYNPNPIKLSNKYAFHGSINDLIQWTYPKISTIRNTTDGIEAFNNCAILSPLTGIQAGSHTTTII